MNGQTKSGFVITLVCVGNLLNTPCIFSGANREKIEQIVEEKLEEKLDALRGRVSKTCKLSDKNVHRVHESMGLAHSANITATEGYKKIKRALKLVKELNKELSASKKAKEGLAGESDGIDLEHELDIMRAKIKEKHKRGIYEQEEKIRAEALVSVETEKWSNIRMILADWKPVIKIVLAVIIIALCFYIIKYGVPALINYVTKPRVVSETSRTGWFGLFGGGKDVDINDLIFSPSLQKQLADLLSRVQTAKKYNENLPNVLFYGDSGVGKTAFAKALAYTSGLDYALTSGSEFAKITDLSIANDELRNLLKWAINDDKGLIVFIDEADSLFASKKLPTTPKITQDFINTFLSLVPDQSQKNLMFIFAANHPGMLDEAIDNRIGMNIEFTLPGATEREKILARYLMKFSQENKDAIVDLHPEIIQSLSKYAQSLEGFCPRSIKFVAEAMIIKARRQEPRQLTNDIAQVVLDVAKRGLQKKTEWKKERDEQIGTLITAQA